MNKPSRSRYCWPMMLPFALAGQLLAGCSQAPASRETAATVARPIREVSVRKPAASQPLVKPSPRPAGVPVAPRSLGFVQKGLHNCGTVAMLLSWAKLHPREAAQQVRRQSDGSYQVRFTGEHTARVTPADLKAARRVRVVKCDAGDRWSEIVLTAFTKKLNQFKAPGDGRSYNALDFSTIEWIAGGYIGWLLSGDKFEAFEIKPETVDTKGRIQVGAAVSTKVLEQRLRAIRNRPATALTNRRIHIWAILDYDVARKRVYARNPRRTQGEWMSLGEFRQRFQLLEYSSSPVGSSA